MYLISGLGNIGKKYDKTRHNVGFDCIDIIAKKYNVKLKTDKSLKSDIGVINIDGEKIILVKPLTYMNLSGEAIRVTKDYYDVELDNIFVVYDDMDIPKGSIKLKLKGSSGGHNGIKSIIAHLKTEQFKRIKIGIKKDYDEDTTSYVLGKFSRKDRKLIDEALERSVTAIEVALKQGFKQAMNEFNERIK